MFANGMWIIVLEMLVALGLGLFIVWWTWPRPRNPDAGTQTDKREEDKRG